MKTLPPAPPRKRKEVLKEIGKRLGIVSELIGRVGKVTVNMIYRRPWRPTRDLTKTDYEFYDKLRRGMARGLHLAGLLVKPINSKIASWTLGQPPQWKLDNEAGQEALNQWWGVHHADILATYKDSLGLGDYYLVFNSDGTLTRVSPDLVEPIVDDNDYSRLIGWRITERHDHPSEMGRYMIEINEYYADERRRWVEFEDRGWIPSSPPTTSPPYPLSNKWMGGEPERYRNLLGVLPVIHVPNNPGGNQLYGTPELEALTASEGGLLYRYDELLEAALDGNVRQGRPTPVMTFQDLAALDDFYTRNATLEHDDETGENYATVDFDGDKLVMAVGDFKYASPAGASSDAKTLLEVLYWIFVEHSEIPDIILGTEMGQSRASGEVQVEPLVKFIGEKRGQVEKWMLSLADVVLRWLALTEPGVRYTGMPVIRWPSLTSEDGQLRFNVIQWAYAEGLLSREDALSLAPTLELEDIPAAIVKADEEAAAQNKDTNRENLFDDALDEAIRNANQTDEENIEAERV